MKLNCINETTILLDMRKEPNNDEQATTISANLSWTQLYNYSLLTLNLKQLNLGFFTNICVRRVFAQKQSVQIYWTFPIAHEIASAWESVWIEMLTMNKLIIACFIVAFAVKVLIADDKDKEYQVMPEGEIYWINSH